MSEGVVGVLSGAIGSRHHGGEAAGLVVGQIGDRGRGRIEAVDVSCPGVSDRLIHAGGADRGKLVAPRDIRIIGYRSALALGEAVADAVVCVGDSAVAAGRGDQTVEGVVPEGLAVGGSYSIGDFGYVVGGVIAVGEALERAGSGVGEGGEAIVPVEAARFGHSVAESHRVNRSEGLISDVRKDGNGGTAIGRLSRDGGDTAHAVARVGDDKAGGIDDGAEAACGVIGVGSTQS